MSTLPSAPQPAASSSARARMFRFDALDRGIVGRLGRTQLVVLAACGTAGFISVLSHRYLPVAAVVLAVGVAITVPEPGGMPVVGWLPIWVRWFVVDRRRRRWYRPLHLTTAGLRADQPALPRWLGGLRLVGHPTGAYGVVHDTDAGAMTVVVPVAGRGFTTRTGSQREFLVEGWGRVFAAFAGAQTGVQVTRISWSDIARPTNLDAHAHRVSEQPGADTPAARDYLAHLASMRVTRHDLLVTVTVQVGTPGNGGGFRTAFDGVDGALTIVRAALSDAGLECGPAASVDELAWLTRTGLDPTGLASAGGPVPGSLVQQLGLVPVGEAGPMAAHTFRDRVEVDTVTHRSFWIAGWPEADQSAAWFEPLLAHEEPGVVQRIVTVVIEPIPDARATAEINIDISRHGADAAAAADGAGRITARNQRKSDAAHAREHEVAAGYHPVAYAGLVTVTAATADELGRASAGFMNRFARSRTSLRAMSMRMDVALAASLPLGLGLSRSEPD